MQNANSSQGQKAPLSLLAGRRDDVRAIESTHLGSICLYYVTSISSLSFSPPLFENPCCRFSHSLPPPVICVGLVIIIAYWKRCGWRCSSASRVKKTSGEKKRKKRNKETSIFSFPPFFSSRIHPGVWETFGAKEEEEEGEERGEAGLQLLFSPSCLGLTSCQKVGCRGGSLPLS